MLARHHRIPFFVAAPLRSLDLALPRGADILIEQRPGDEVALLQGRRIVAEGVRVWNPRSLNVPTHLCLLICPYDRMTI